MPDTGDKGPRKERSFEDASRFVHLVADKRGWALNQDPDFVDVLIEGLQTNVNRYGFYLCPCRDSWGDRKKDGDIACPCVYADPDIEEYGHCYCALFLSKQFVEQGKTPRHIPERRPPEYYPE
jgi:ferredoxin-thioredoxin reductase catalytic subunit